MASENILANVPNAVITAFAAVGLLYLSTKVVNYIYLLLELFVLSGTSLRKYGKPGTWAVITGASDGLGKEFALQLAQKGFNLVLVSRTESKLQALSQEIEQKHAGTKVKTKILAMDFAKDNDSDYAKFKELVNSLDVAILINNVGQSHNIPVPFIETPEDEIKNIVTINCMGTLKVTQIVAPGMAQRKRGLILTMGSMGGTLPTPLLATYSGSKAFLQQWSTALGGELASSGVDVEIALASLITGGMSKIRRPSLNIPTPRRFVRDTLGKLGLSCGAQGMAYTSTPYWGHALQLWWIENTVGLMSLPTLWFNKRIHVDIRKRALKKKEREAKKSS